MLGEIIFVVCFTVVLTFSSLVMYKRGLNKGFTAGVIWMSDEVKKSIENGEL